MCAGRYIHPEGLPSDYTISLLFRLLPDTPQEPFALWEVLNKNNEPLVGVILDSESQKICLYGFRCDYDASSCCMPKTTN